MKLSPGIAATTAAALLSGCAATPDAARPSVSTAGTTTGFLHGEAAAPGQALKYALYVPRDYTPDRPWPLIVFLHGRGECGSDGQKQIAQGIGTNILWNASRWPCLVVLPQKPDAERPWEDFGDALLSLVADLRRSYAVDADRIALTGLSQGGHGAWALGAAHADLWSCVVPICGYARPLKPEQIAQDLRRTPVWAFHGDADEVVPAAQSTIIVESLRTLGGDVRFTVYPGVNHNAWDRAYAEKDLPAFLMQPKRRR